MGKRSARKRPARRDNVVPLGTARVRSISGRRAAVFDLGTRGIWVSCQQFCRETSRALDFVQKRIHEHALRPEAGPSGEALYRLKDLLNAVILRDADAMNPEALDPFRRKAFWAAELDKLALEMKSRELIPRLEVEAERSRVLTLITRFLDTLPDVLERDCGLGGDALTQLERRLDAVREALYRSSNGDLADDA